MNQQGRAHKTRLCFYFAIGNVKVKYFPDHLTCFRSKPLHRALSANTDVELLLRGNVTVREVAERIVVTAVDPI